jgi:hypothetical protein
MFYEFTNYNGNIIENWVNSWNIRGHPKEIFSNLIDCDNYNNWPRSTFDAQNLKNLASYDYKFFSNRLNLTYDIYIWIFLFKNK